MFPWTVNTLAFCYWQSRLIEKCKLKQIHFLIVTFPTRHEGSIKKISINCSSCLILGLVSCCLCVLPCFVFQLFFVSLKILHLDHTVPAESPLFHLAISSFSELLQRSIFLSLLRKRAWGFMGKSSFQKLRRFVVHASKSNLWANLCIRQMVPGWAAKCFHAWMSFLTKRLPHVDDVSLHSSLLWLCEYN